MCKTLWCGVSHPSQEKTWQHRETKKRIKHIALIKSIDQLSSKTTNYFRLHFSFGHWYRESWATVPVWGLTRSLTLWVNAMFPKSPVAAHQGCRSWRCSHCWGKPEIVTGPNAFPNTASQLNYMGLKFGRVVLESLILLLAIPEWLQTEQTTLSYFVHEFI